MTCWRHRQPKMGLRRWTESSYVLQRWLIWPLYSMQTSCCIACYAFCLFSMSMGWKRRFLRHWGRGFEKSCQQFEQTIIMRNYIDFQKHGLLTHCSCSFEQNGALHFGSTTTMKCVNCQQTQREKELIRLTFQVANKRHTYILTSGRKFHSLIILKARCY